jgi:D-xylose transport system permease protein
MTMLGIVVARATPVVVSETTLPATALDAGSAWRHPPSVVLPDRAERHHMHGCRRSVVRRSRPRATHVPLAVLILVAFVAGMQYVAKRTLFGRHVFAVGGNAEAARRAGVHTRRIRILVFGISGAMAAIGGILAASRLLAVDQSSGGSDLLLFAIAGPVIAGTSLFGGRGSVWSALLGAITIGSISNGMDLLALQSSVKFMVTGGVLVAAVIVDALARRNRQARA